MTPETMIVPEGTDPGFDPDLAMVGQGRKALKLAAGFFLMLGIGGGLVPIGGAVVGSGQMVVESRTKSVAHPGGGTVAQILVGEGQHVRKGQILVRLDDRVAGADASLSALSLDQLLARKARLEAEQAGSPSIYFPEILARRKDATALRAMAEQRQMFVIGAREKAGMIAQLEARIRQYRQQIAGYKAQILAFRRQRDLIAPEREGLRALYEKRLVTLNRLNQLERTEADLEGNIGALNAQIAQTEARISETREQMIQIAQSQRSSAGAALTILDDQLNQQQLRNISAKDVHERTLIRAPYDGIVENLTLTAIGDVVKPAETLMAIVPDKDRLLVEGRILPADIDRLHDGQEAVLRLSAIKGGVTPELRGRIVYVGTQQINDRTGGYSYFPIRIEMEMAGASFDRERLKPGMPVDMLISTGDRTMLSYVTRPLRDQFARAFRDH